MRSRNSISKLKVLRNSKMIDVSLRNILVANFEKLFESKTPPYSFLTSSIGYIYPEKLKESDLFAIKALFKNTKALVIDLRCYPSFYMPDAFGAWLKKSKSPFARVTHPSLDYPGTIKYGRIESNGNILDPSDADTYSGKVIILVNSSTQSRAEYAAMALASVPGAIVLGSQTSGSDGDVSSINIAGGIRTRMSGIGILYPDLSLTQGYGVKIDVKINQSVEGIQSGRDELLEQALKYLERLFGKPKNQY